MIGFSPQIIKNYNDMWNYLNKKRRFQFLLIITLMVASSLTDTIGIGAVVPFISIMSSNEISNNEYVKIISDYFPGIRNIDSYKYFMFIIFVIISLIASILRLLTSWSITRLSFISGAEIAGEIYRRTLYQPYEVHISRNSSELISGLIKKADNIVFSSILPGINFISSIILVIFLAVTIVVINLYAAIIAALFFGLTYTIIIKSVRSKLLRNGKKINSELTKKVKALQEGLGGIRDVLLDNTQDVYFKLYQNSDFPLQLAHASNTFISASPRAIIELVGMLSIAAYSYNISNTDSGLINTIPNIAALALAAQRLMPAMNQAYSNWATISGAQDEVASVLELLHQNIDHLNLENEKESLKFTQSLRTENICFKYDQTSKSNILSNISVIIAGGSKTGISGRSGSGKSTFVDLLMGLLKPQSGAIFIDNVRLSPENVRSWQSLISHVPQSIFLSDATIAENIAFGVPKEHIDYERVVKAAKQAQIHDFILAQHRGYDHIVGERGIRLSGGQRQRIGIARALYKESSLIIFDEATSALDTQTEEAVMNTIYNLDTNLTILIIAHRISTLRYCDNIIEFDHGNVVRKGSYKELFDDK